jgi:hypothetical protein
MHADALAGLHPHIEDAYVLVVEQQLVRLRGNPGHVLGCKRCEAYRQ